MSFWTTFFTDVFAQSLQGEETTLDDLRDLIQGTTAAAKDTQPLLKLAHYGSQRSPAGALRWDANVLSCSGCELDYDREAMPLTEATARLDAAGLAYLGYTTAQHTASTPRWRILLPFAKELPPGERARMVSRANGVLGGVLSAESWAISTAFYYGNIAGRTVVEIVVGDGEEYIDEAEELDQTAQPFRAPAGQAGKGTKPDLDLLDEHELLELIQTGQVYYGAAKRLIELWADQKVPESDARQNLQNAFDAVPVADRDTKWGKRRGNIPRWVKQGFARVAKRKGKFFSALVDYLEHTTSWRGAVRLNRFAQTVEVCDPFPPRPGQTIGAWRAVREPADLLETLILVQADGFPTARKGVVLDALILAAERHAYHPVREWLDSLTWDGKERINTLFLIYFPGELPPDGQDTESTGKIVCYYERTAKCFMVGAVARIMAPGCKVDALPIVIGLQGYGKSRGIRMLVPNPTWYSDDLSPYLIDRDTKDSLNGVWIIELAEIPHLRKEAERVKAFFSRQTDRFRRAYDRLTNDWPRQCAFIGSSNDLEFADATGNRRFWPIPLAKPVDVSAIERDRDQLWAEAVHWYRDGYRWWLAPEVEAIAGEMQGAYAERDIWDEPVATWIDTKFPPDKNTGTQTIEPFTVSDILEAFGYVLKPEDRPDLPIAGKTEEMRVARCLKRLGYRRDPHRHRRDGRQVCFWVPT